MELNTAEKFLLVIHHPDKSRNLIPEQMRNAGLAGALILDLHLEGAISLSGKILKVNSRSTKISDAHQAVLKKMSDASRPKKVKNWILLVARNNLRYRRMVQEGLRKKGLMNLERKRFLFIPYLKTHIQNKGVRNQLVVDLRTTLLGKMEVTPAVAPMLGLVQACKLHKVLSRNKAELKTIRDRAKIFMESDAIAAGVDKTVKEMIAATVAITTVITTSAVVSATSG